MYNFVHKNKIFKFFITVFVFVQLFGLLAIPGTARAFPVEDAATAGMFSLQTVKKSQDSIQDSLMGAALGSLVKAASYFMKKLAYDAATYIASGGKGQGAMAFKQGFGSYLTNTLKDTAADAIDQLGKPLGLDLCQTPNIKTQAFLQVSLRQMYKTPSKSGGSGGLGGLTSGLGSSMGGLGGTSSGGGSPASGPQPDCSFQSMQSNWTTGLSQKYGADGEKMADQFFANSLRTGGDDFSLALGAESKIDRLQSAAAVGNANQRLEGQGSKPVTDLISGNIKTPAQTIKEESTALTGKEKGKSDSAQISGIYGSGALQILPMALSTFLNTLTGQLLKTLFSGGLFGGGDDTPFQAWDANSFAAQYVSQDREAAKNAFGFLVAGAPAKGVSSLPIVERFVSCPDSPPDINTCVIDDGFAEAIKRADMGRPLTIREAMGGNDVNQDELLHPNWPLIPPSREVDNTDKNCRLNYYCYSNLQKLRKARIIPLGFELAASKVDPDNISAWTLKTIVDNYDNCNYDKDGKVVPDPKYPYCHLIDPNWLIKSPDARCEADVIGERLESSDANLRHKDCVDISTCLSEDQNGNCTGGVYGYCIKEKNIWRLSAKSCPAYYNTCKTYQDIDSNTVSYLSRTVDYGQCTDKDVGCLAYSTEKDANDNWIPSAYAQGQDYKFYGRNQTLYFNQNIDDKTCEESNEGCSAFYPVSGIVGFHFLDYSNTASIKVLKKAPDYLGCYTVDDSVPQRIVWPKTKVDLLKLTTDARCDKFSAACLPEEVGCSAYQPGDGGPVIPGIVGENSCDSKCIGYNTFKQLATAFEPEKFPLYFVPKISEDKGMTCTAENVGCDEFTNIDEQAKGGEALEHYSWLKYCERPTATNEKVFYSWEGGASQGYVLRNYKLYQISSDENTYLNLSSPVIAGEFPAGSPGYADDSPEAMAKNYAVCNAQIYSDIIKNPTEDSPDCKALYDKNGTIYYRLLSKTVTVDPSCHPLRKTESYLYVDPQLTETSLPTCAAKGGFWNGSECQRCYNGGKYNNGTCTYWTISRPNESASCTAKAVGCREYKGNNGNRPVDVFGYDFGYDTFEDVTSTVLSVWQAQAGSQVGISTESSHVTGHSLRITGGAERIIESNSLGQGQWYELSFWARGDSQNLKITLQQNGVEISSFTGKSAKDVDFKSTIGSEWQNYKFGPVQFNGSTDTSTLLTFNSLLVGTTAGEYYLDNVRLTAVPDNAYLIKNSWKVPIKLSSDEWFNADAPAECYAEPDDAVSPYPGKALGCAAYSDIANDNIETPLVGFEKLCREKAVGCNAFYDSYNRVSGIDKDKLKQYYNLFCTPGQVCDGGVNDGKQCDSWNSAVPPYSCASLCVDVGGKHKTPDICEVSFGDGQEQQSCEVQSGAKGCYISQLSVPDGEDINDVFDYNAQIFTQLSIVSSTVVIPAASAEPVYLTTYNFANNTSLVCADKDSIGCQKLGKETHILPNTASTSYAFEDVYRKVVPTNYLGDSGTLCRDDLVGCKAYSYGLDNYYFKDPLIAGNSLCSYKAQDKTKPGQPYGWFVKDVGYCYDSSSQKITPNRLCRSNEECGQGNTCKGQTEATVPCYSDYLHSQAEYGIWSNGVIDKYKGMVGMCDEENNGCTEVIDPADTSNSASGTVYNLIYTKAVADSAAACNNKASLKQGCILFDRTENPNKLYSSSKTYASSLATKPEKYGLVNLETTGVLDTNMLLKVDRDRTCGEWLSCKTYLTEKGKDGRSFRLCYEFGVCNKLDASGECASDGWVDLNNDNSGKQILDEKTYVSRPYDWYDQEYSGYSLFNRYNLATYKAFYFSGDNYKYLSHVENDPGCKASGSDLTKLCGNGGVCYQGKCAYPVDNKFTNPASYSNTAIFKNSLNGQSICKSHPEDSSPFNPTLSTVEGEIKELTNCANGYFSTSTGICSFANPLKNFIRYETANKQNNYESANICQGKIGTTDCSCEYRKVKYGSQVDYWSLSINKSLIPKGVCQTGTGDNDKIGKPCLVNADCGQSGLCSLASEENTYMGQRGFCLEYDYSYPLGKDSKNKDIFPCLTYLPIDLSVGSIDNYHSSVKAGYVPSTDGDGLNPGSVYCTEATTGQFIDERGGSDYVKLDDYIVPTSYGGAATRPTTAWDVFSVFRRERGLRVWDQIAEHYGEDIQTGFENRYNACTDYGYPIKSESGGRNYQFVSVDSYFKSWVGVGSDPLSWQPYHTAEGLPSDDPDFDTDNFLWLMNNNNGGDCPVLDQIDLPIFYTYLQYYAWYKINPTAQVLWAMSPGGTNSFFEFGFWASDGSCRTNSRRVWTPFGWAHIPTGTECMQNNPPYQYDGEIIESSIRGLYLAPFLYHTDSLNGNSLRYTLMDDIKIDVDTLRQQFEANSGAVPNIIAGDDWSYALQHLPLNPSTITGGDHSHYNFSKRWDKTIDVYTFYAKKKDKSEIVIGALVDNAKSECAMRAGTEDKYEEEDTTVTADNKHKWGLKDILRAELNCSGLDPWDYSTNNVASGHFEPLIQKCGRRYTTYLDCKDDNTPTYSGGYVAKFIHFRQDPNNPNKYIISKDNYEDLNDNRGLAWVGDAPEAVRYIKFFAPSVIADFYPKCTEFTSVYNDTLSGTKESTDKAWTDRIWQYANDILKVGGNRYRLYNESEKNSKPFGTLNLGNSAFEGTEDTVNKTLTNYFFEQPVSFGYPFSCQSPFFRDDTNHVISYGLRDGSTPCQVLLNNQRFESTADPYKKIADGLFSPRYNFWVGDNISGKHLLANLFAKSFKVYTRNSQNYDKFNSTATWDYSGLYEPISGIDCLNKTKNDLREEFCGLLVPQIYNLNPYTCFGVGGGSANLSCGAWTKGVTINKQNYLVARYDNINKFEDENNNNYPDPIVASGIYNAHLNFFAFADQNRLPIRRIMVDWGDNSDILNSETFGYYTNAKPYCESVDEGAPTVKHCFNNLGIDTQLTCKEDLDCKGFNNGVCKNLPVERTVKSFGDSTRACNNNYYQFNHVYNCNSDNTNTDVNSTNFNIDELAGILTLAPTIDRVCVFQPKVQVLDNWGWCNGSCKGTDKGCYTGKDPVTGSEIDECRVNNPQAWTTSAAKIIVLPRQ